jgi:ABC-type lipoprotein release transport system permease subunit
MKSVLSYALATARARPGPPLFAASAVALVVVATGLLASLVGTAERLLVATADPRNLIVLARGASSEGTSAIAWPAVNALRGKPGIAAARDGRPLVSAELVVEPTVRPARRVTAGDALDAGEGVGSRGSGAATSVDGVEGGGELFRPRDDGDQRSIAVVARGLDPGALAFHEGVHLRSGRWPRRGAQQALVGARLMARLGVGLGDRLRWGAREWSIVGLLDAGGSAYDDEVWLDRNDLAIDAGRADTVSVVRIRARSPDDLDALAQRIAADASLSLDALTETAFYRRHGHASRALRGLVALTALLSGAAAAAGLANVLHATVRSRRRELGLLRALGFGRWWIVGAVQVEALGIALVGLATGSFLAAVATPLLGPRLVARLALAIGSHASGGAQALDLAAADLAPGLALTLGVGLTAGIGPAWRAARLRPTEVLRAG